MKTKESLQTPVTFYQSIRHNVPEDLNFQQHRCENLKFSKMYRMSINSFPDYKHLLQENYMEYKYIFFTTI